MCSNLLIRAFVLIQEFGKVPEDPADAVADDINNPVNHITFLLY